MIKFILNLTLFCLFITEIFSQSTNPCLNSNCKNLAKCIPLNQYNYTCECNSTYWTGRYCDKPTDKNSCFSNPCYLNSICLFDEILNTYKCLCQPGYTGPSCDQLIDVCQSFPCKNKGRCTNINRFGIRQPNFYRCACQTGYTGTNCEVQINQCDSSPCLNFGICINKPDQYECICLPSYNGTRCENDYSLNNFTCSCADGYFGKKCEIQLNQCGNIINPCGTGICDPTPNGDLEYTCYCLPGFTGKNCGIPVDLCKSNPCNFGGKCTMPTPNDYSCECPIGTFGKSCEINIDECKSRPCLNNGSCVETSINSYSCLCPDRYFGLNCEILAVECLPDTCKNGGICIATINGPSCICIDSFTGKNCEISLSGCVSQPCMNNGTCLKSLNNTYKCLCQAPYTGQSCESTYDLCSLFNPCLNSAECISNGPSITCKCSQFYSGKFCESYFSICETNPCNSNGKCFAESPLDYKCFCNRGYTGVNCTEIINSCLSNPCKHGSCTPILNNYVCNCNPGFTSKRCEVEINACESNPCFNGGICYDYFNYYNCSCAPDFTGNNCEISKDPCRFVTCSNNGKCVNKFGIAFCQCYPPFYGDLCQFSRDYCVSRPCQNAGRCISNSTSYFCSCTVGFTGNNCETVIDPCQDYCLNNGTCFTDSRLMIGCQCPCQYEGIRCENKVNYCNSTSLCKNGKCVENGCDYKCQCNCGYTGRFCDVKINQCELLQENSPKCLNGGICINNGCNFTCNCTSGFTGPNCQIIKNLCDPSYCQNGAQCLDLTNDYFCSCPCKYYTGKNCQNYTDICIEKKSECLNGGTCISKGCHFECKCSKFFQGKNCELKADPCSYNTCYNNGTCISDLNKDTFICSCRAPYTGIDCSQLINPVSSCLSSPCADPKICIDIGPSKYNCTCPPSYTGTRCEVRIRYCLSSPCNGGQCVEIYSNEGYKCNCPVGLTGKQCQTSIDTCASRPCLNNGTCSQSRPNTFKCTCQPGFTGTLCQSRIDPCLSFPCKNEGICYNPTQTEYACNCSQTCFNGQNCDLIDNPCKTQACNGNGVCLTTGPCKAKCLCLPGWTGASCEIKLNPCLSQPCGNNGTCQSNLETWSCVCPEGFTGSRCNIQKLACSSSPCQNGGFCENSLNSFSFKCNCLPGWSGTACEIDVNECEKNPCINGGTCIEEKINSYKCYCPKGYSGEFCEQLLDLCNSQPCLNSATCISNFNNTFTCVCGNGFYGSRCEYESNECTSNPCLNDGICIDYVNSYECRCPKEYTGANCNITSCTNYCFNGGTCFSDSRFTKIMCVCQTGFTGDRCELLDNPCVSNPCIEKQGKCVSRYYGYYECFCNYGFTGSNCETKIDFCLNNPCIRGKCVTKPSGIAVCLCPSGYTGRYCEVSLNTCEPKNPCLNGGKCLLPISYNISICPSGTTGTYCQNIIDLCATNPCKSNAAVCVQDRINSFKCVCPPYETGQYCEQTINLCDTNPCPSNIKCIQTSYTETKCLCPPGFTGPRCNERYDVCESNPCINGNCVSPLPGILRCNCVKGYRGTFCHESVIICDSITCLNGGYCVSNSSTNSFFNCICPKGFTGQYCEIPIDPCLNSISPCSQNGVCLYLSPGEYYCKCNNSCFYGKSCELNYDPCKANPCKNSGQCVQNQQNCTYKCLCKPGFEGFNCEINADPCLITSTPCLNSGTCIQNGTNSYTCKCSPHYSGKFCETPIDPCTLKTCLNGGVCFYDNDYKQTKCLCQYGYTGLDCSANVDFCASFPCKNGGNCVTRNLSVFECNCKTGFGGQYCEEELDMCAILNPCHYGSCFRGSPGEYLCFCFNGWIGKNCDTKISFCSSNPCKNGMCRDYIGGYLCECSTGFDGPECTNRIDACLFSPCINGLCIADAKNSSAYSCLCDIGYTGKNCDVGLDLCENNGNCTNRSKCIKLSQNFAYCDCLSGYSGRYCENIISRCDLVKCYNGGTCNTTSLNSFVCNCLPGFTGTYCQNQEDLCKPNPCLNGATCKSSNGFYTCVCPKNYGGVNCQFSQECDDNPCENSALCSKLLDGTPKCTCTPGFTGALCDRIINACDSKPCLNNGTCYRYNFTQYICSCSPGFSGMQCNTDIDECVQNPCKNNGICKNTIGSFLCNCQPGFTGNDCSTVITEPCKFNTCSQQGTVRCVPIGFGNIYACICKSGYFGDNCENENQPCQSLPCLNNGECVISSDNTYNCICPKDYFGSRCEFKSDICSTYKPCGPYGQCSTLNSTSYKCTCVPGFTGENCEILIDTCKSKPCLNNGTCVASINYYTCLCQNTHYGVNCEQPLDRCSLFSCFNGGTCRATFNSTICLCPEGFEGPQCEFNKQCQVNCKNGGLCNATGNGCICLPDYNGIDCSILINQCSLKPCLNNAQCINKLNGYECNCTNGFAGKNCEIQTNPCSSNPCGQNGVCSVLNTYSYKCTCFHPFSGVNCEKALTLCNFINCGQGNCIVAQNDSFSAKCNCFPGYTGQYCNLKLEGQGCVSSPCRNGGKCNDNPSGNYSCNCTAEYTGLNCEIIQTCVPGYNYCASLPCLNGGTCSVTENCTISCACNINTSYGEFCQFSRRQSIFSVSEQLNFVSCEPDVNFNLEIKPCIVQAWQQTNPQFACPLGFEMLPNITDRCFTYLTVNSTNFTKKMAEYNCSILGGSLIAFETQNKLNAILEWINLTQKTKSSYFWTSMAVFRNFSNSQSDWSWVWASKLTNNLQTIIYDNWAPFQGNNFNGDSVYLNTSDFRFYVGLGSRDYSSNNNKLSGLICESGVNGLNDQQLNIIELNKQSVFTNTGENAVQIAYIVNITLSDSTSALNQIKPPNDTVYSHTLKESCQKNIFVDKKDGLIFSIENLFYVDICGSVANQVHKDMIRDAILDSWLVARPEFLWCSIQRNCLKITIVQTKFSNIDSWNQVTRFFYAVSVNDVLIEPNQENMTPTGDIIKSNVEKIKKNYYQNYLVCGVLVDSIKTESYLSTPLIKNASFPLIFSKYVLGSENSVASNIKNAIKNAVYASNAGLDRSLSLEIILNEEFEDVFIISQYYDRIPSYRFSINPSMISYPSTLSSFKILLNNQLLSYATQNVLDEIQFYFMIQQQLFSDPQIRSLSLNSFSPISQPILKPFDTFLRISLTTNLLDKDKKLFEDKIIDFISENRIEFELCKKCWNNTNSFTVKYVYTDVLIDSKAQRFFDLWFIIVIENPNLNNQLTIIDLSEEESFKIVYESKKSQLYSELNLIKISYQTIGTFYSTYTDESILRRYLSSIRLNLNQSVLNEDIIPLKNALVNAVKLKDNKNTNQENYVIEYWGQNEYIKNANEIDSYWQVFFYVKSQQSSKIFIQNYDFEINEILMNGFFSLYKSSRANKFESNTPFEPKIDFLANLDIYYLPCYGYISYDSYYLIFNILNRVWNETYFDQDDLNIWPHLKIEYFDGLIMSYISAKGSYSVIPYVVRAYSDNRLLSPSLHKQPQFERLKQSLAGICELNDDISKLYREDSLNYIQAVGTINLDQAKSYLPVINSDYDSYFNYLNFINQNNNIKQTKQAEILSVENIIINSIVATRIYYQIYANTTQPFNAFNYQIRYTNFKITSSEQNLNALLARRSKQIFGRIDLFTRAKIQDINLILEWLPKFSIELERGKELSLDQKLRIERSLTNYWNLTLNKNNKGQAKLIEVQLAFSKEYFNFKTNNYATQIYYIIALNGLVKYNSDLPLINSKSTSDLKNELLKVGFKLYDKNSITSIRKIYLDTFSKLANFNFDKLSDLLKEAWIEFIHNDSNLLFNQLQLSIKVKVLEQNLYYDKEKPIIGIKYIITLNDLDPSVYLIFDIPKKYLESKIKPFNLVVGSPLLARRMYVYSSRIHDLSTFKNSSLMKEKISNIWKNKNEINNLDNPSVVYNTPYYSIENQNLFSNFINVPFYRLTYTQSLNGIEPSLLFYQSPIENDFDQDLLISLNANLMGFCFYNCFNYKQNSLIISKQFSSDASKLIEIIQKTWIETNEIKSDLLNKNEIKIKFLSNKRSFTTDKKSDKTFVLFNVFINNIYTENQYDSMDLKEPTKDDYLKQFEIEYPNIESIDLNTISDWSFIADDESNNQINQTTVKNNFVNSKTVDPQTSNTNLKLNSVEWWAILLIIIGILLILAITILIVIYSYTKLNSNPNRKLLTNNSDASSEASAEVREDFGKFTILANTFPTTSNEIEENNEDENLNIEIDEDDLKSQNSESLTSFNLKTEPIFVQKVKSQIIKNKECETVFYPGLTIEQVVPNPIYSKKDEELITNVYITNNTVSSEIQVTNLKYLTSGKDEIGTLNSNKVLKNWQELNKEKSNSD